MIFGMRQMHKILFLLLVFVTQAAYAEDPTWGLPQLMQAMAKINESKVTFTEKKTMSVLSEPLVLSGELYYMRPNRIERHVLKPKEEHWVVEGDSLVMTQGKKQRKISLSAYPIAQAFIESIRATLAGDQRMLESFYRIKFEGTEKNWALYLQPIDTHMLQYIESIKINGVGSQITVIETIETNGDKSVMTIKQDKL
jgi:outer membrane lipoprotein-sorting protein